MGERARARRAQAEAEERAQREAEEHKRDQRDREEAVARFLEGPPDGCNVCYSFSKVYTGGPLYWTWWHMTVVKPELRPVPPRWDGDGDEPIEHCTCRCHGPDGLPLFMIAYA